jgi:hypothetical protein
MFQRHFRLGLAAATLGLSACATTPSSSSAPTSTSAANPLASPTEYFAAYLNVNNIILFGKIERSDAEWIVFRDVFFLRTAVDPESKAVKAELTRRDQEGHKPAETAVRRSSLLVLEPVAEGSRIIAMIRDRQPR